jgi:hypothetical protein
MEFNLDPEDEDIQVKILSLKSTEGFHLSFEQKENEEDVRLYQHLFGEEVFVMTIERQKIGDIIYALEDFL